MFKRAALLAGLAAMAAIALTAPAFAASGGELVDPLTFRIAIFVLAIFVGYYVVWSVTPALHTPLMAVTNAISSVIIVGALVAAAAGLPGGADAAVTTQTWIAKGLGGVAVALAAVNIFGGFLVTQRMLAMYKKKDKPAPKAEAK
jgi:H+-translocating NAD(P) transhydrogenase subunit alpha